MSLFDISLKNDLSFSLNVFESDDAANPSLPNFIARLTFIGTIPAYGTIDLFPDSEMTSVYICYDLNNKPVKRIVVSAGSGQTSFDITTVDVEIISSTYSFFEFIKKYPNDEISKNFQNLIEGGNTPPDAIDAFFKSTVDYQMCTYVSYILVVSTLSRYSVTNQVDSLAHVSYSLKSLIEYLGVSWPSLLPDITVDNFTCTSFNGNGNLISLGCDVAIKDIDFGSEITKNIYTINPFNSIKVVHVFIFFDYTITTDFVTISLQFGLDFIKIPVSASTDITLNDPKITFSFDPASEEVSFKAQATIPFKLFDNPPFNADISMVIGVQEAEIGVVISGDNSVLLTPPVIQGVHFTSFGVGMGVFFQPIIGYALGVQGSFTIGNSEKDVQVEDDRFAVVCELIGDIPNPIFISFYVAQISLSDIVTIFTNTNLNIDFPVSVKQLSFVWQENPSQPVILPDGSTVQYLFGFSGYLDFFGLDFYGDVNINPVAGVNGIITMSPYSLGPLALRGKGKEISIKVDDAGNPIKNNYVPTTSTEEIAIQNAQTQVLIRSGGPVMQLNTFTSPYFLVSITIEFLECKESVEASVTNGGIMYELDFEVLLTSKMSCIIKNYQSFDGTFMYGADFMIPILNSVDVFNLGNIHFKSTINAELKIEIDNDVRFTFTGSFVFCGYNSSIGSIELDVNIKSLQDILDIVEQWIIDNAASLFGNLYADAAHWINSINEEIILLATNTAMYVIDGFYLVYGENVEAVGELLKGSTYLLDDVSIGLKDVYDASATAAANVMVTAYNASEEAVASALKVAGYTADEVAESLVNVFDASMESTVGILLEVGYSAEVVAQTMVNVFNATEEEVVATLKAFGYTLDEAGNWIVDTAKATADDTKSAADDIIKQAEDGTKDVADASKDAADEAIKATTDAAKDATDTAKDVADQAVKAAKDATDDAVKQAKDATDAAKSVTDNALKAAADALNPF